VKKRFKKIVVYYIKDVIKQLIYPFHLKTKGLLIYTPGQKLRGGSKRTLEPPLMDVGKYSVWPPYLKKGIAPVYFKNTINSMMANALFKKISGSFFWIFGPTFPPMIAPAAIRAAIIQSG
jgi:hypothetical protein